MFAENQTTIYLESIGDVFHIAQLQKIARAFIDEHTIRLTPNSDNPNVSFVYCGVLPPKDKKDVIESLKNVYSLHVQNESKE